MSACGAHSAIVSHITHWPRRSQGFRAGAKFPENSFGRFLSELESLRYFDHRPAAEAPILMISSTTLAPDESKLHCPSYCVAICYQTFAEIPQSPGGKVRFVHMH